MHRVFSTVFLSFLLVAVVLAQDPIPGFYQRNVERQRALERQALQAVEARSTEQFLNDLTREPHHAGSKGARASAEYVQQRFKEFGFDSKLVEYHVLLPYPIEVTVTILEPIEKELAIKEEVDFHPEALMPFNAYSPSSDVTAEVVYANYGFAEDYKKLREMGVDVKGTIVLARYGKGYRGLKVKDAHEAGAVGIILYSDPIDDGYVAGDVYPKGRMRPWDGVQRGSIRFSESYPGDPLTPGIPATKNAKRVKIEDDPDMPKIPCIPISYGSAQHILKTLEGQSVPREWQGGLPFTYHTGAGPTKVRMVTKMDFQIRPIWNNIAELKGTDEPEKKIILGGHRDGWVFGAQDPNSGSAVLLEAARVIGELVKKGWKPKRTLVFAQWDAEEFGLIGSTEWGEQFRDELRKNAVVYMNFDGTVSGSNFGAGGVPSLDAFIREMTKSVNDPQKNIPVFAAWWQSQNRSQLKGEDQPIPENATISIGRLGGGSDHVVFLNHIGVPSMGFSFGGPNGIYHSYYDNFDWMRRHGDPGFVYHATAAKMALLAAMRMANTDVLPISVTPYSVDIENQLVALQKKFPQTDFETLLLKTRKWQNDARELDSLLLAKELPGKQLRESNALLMSLERVFVRDNGLPGREWYRHRVVAASGYASIGLPGISGALESGDTETLKKEMVLFERILDEVHAQTFKAKKLFGK